MRILRDFGFNSLRYIYPYLEGTDWNELVLKEGWNKVKDYVLKNQKKYDFKGQILSRLKGLR